MRYFYLFWGLALAGGLARPATAQTLNPTFAAVTSLYSAGYVTALGPGQADGKRLLSCSATRVNGAPFSGSLLRLDATGAIDQPFTQNVAGATPAVRIRGLPGGQYLLQGAGGSISVGGQTRIGLLRLNADGTVDPSFTINFSPQLGGYPGYLRDYAVQADGKILVGGGFSRFNDQAANSLARLNADGSVDGTFSVGTGAGPGLYSAVAALVVQADGKILAGGDFSQFSGQAANLLVRLTASGALDPSFTPALGSLSEVNGLVVQPDGNILVYGTRQQGSTTLLRLLPSGALDPSFSLSPALDGSLVALGAELPVQLQPDGRLVVVGSFDLPGYHRVARLTASGELDVTFQAPEGPDQLPVVVGVQPGGDILLGGQFAIGPQEVALAHLASSGSLDPSYLPNFQQNGSLETLVRQSDGSLLAGGYFNEWNGQPVHRVVHLSADGVLDPSYGAGSPAFAKGVNVLLSQPDGKVVVGSSQGLFRLLPDGAPDGSFTFPAAARPYVTALAQQADGKLLVLGSLGTTAGGGSAYSRVVRLTATGAFDPSFAAPPLPVQARAGAVLVQPDGRIVLASNSDGASGQATVQRVEASGVADASFTAPPFTYPAGGPYLTALAQQPDGRLLVAGVFSQVGAVAQNHLARLTTTGELDASFAPGTLLPSNTALSALALQPNGRVLVGGNVFVSGYQALLRLLPTGALDASFTSAANPSGTVTTLLVQPDGGIVLQGYFERVAGQPRRSLARITAPGVLAVAAPAAVAAATTLWPVPAHDVLRVLPAPGAHPQQAELLDALGRVVQRRALAGPGEFSLDTRALPAGLYVLRLRYAEGTVSRRLAVE